MCIEQEPTPDHVADVRVPEVEQRPRGLIRHVVSRPESILSFNLNDPDHVFTEEERKSLERDLGKLARQNRLPGCI